MSRPRRRNGLVSAPVDAGDVHDSARMADVSVVVHDRANQRDIALECGVHVVADLVRGIFRHLERETAGLTEQDVAEVDQADVGLVAAGAEVDRPHRGFENRLVAETRTASIRPELDLGVDTVTVPIAKTGQEDAGAWRHNPCRATPHNLAVAHLGFSPGKAGLDVIDERRQTGDRREGKAAPLPPKPPVPPITTSTRVDEEACAGTGQRADNDIIDADVIDAETGEFVDEREIVKETGEQTDAVNDGEPEDTIGDYFERMNAAMAEAGDAASIAEIWNDMDPLAKFEGDEESQALDTSIKRRHVQRVGQKNG